IDSGFWKIATSMRQSKSEIDYDVQSNRGLIPFRWLTSETQVEYQTFKRTMSLNAHFISPQKADGSFHNRCWSSSFNTLYHQQLSRKFDIGLEGDYSLMGADWRYNGEQYGKLDKVELFHATGWISYQPRSSLTLIGGGKWFSSRCGDDSYLDIWPFSFMDVFLDSRTRLKKADIDALSPFLSATWKKGFRYGSLSGELKLTAEYNHLFQKQDIVIKQRYYIMFPFFLGYDTNEYDFSNEIDGYFVLPISTTLAWKEWTLSCKIQQVIPVKWKDIDLQDSNPNQTSQNKTRDSGGTRLIIVLSAPL
ncbi:MAG: hypothetical protein JXR56_00700, partial [Candidatus Cloacimonetes bacterium]|nr:hypothetical protein [Candidatus Cloacimonadota bacterium]